MWQTLKSRSLRGTYILIPATTTKVRSTTEAHPYIPRRYDEFEELMSARNEEEKIYFSYPPLSAYFTCKYETRWWQVLSLM
jgi:hypothetical protein